MSGGRVRLPVHRSVDKRRGVNVAHIGQFDQETRQRLAGLFKTRTRNESAKVFACAAPGADTREALTE